MTDLEASIARLQAFRDAIDDDGVVDEDSGLTAADLDAVLSHVRQPNSGPNVVGSTAGDTVYGTNRLEPK